MNKHPSTPPRSVVVCTSVVVFFRITVLPVIFRGRRRDTRTSAPVNMMTILRTKTALINPSAPSDSQNADNEENNLIAISDSVGSCEMW
jgi:hypothetical protein